MLTASTTSDQRGRPGDVDPPAGHRRGQRRRAGRAWRRRRGRSRPGTQDDRRRPTRTLSWRKKMTHSTVETRKKAMPGGLVEQRRARGTSGRGRRRRPPPPARATPAGRQVGHGDDPGGPVAQRGHEADQRGLQAEVGDRGHDLHGGQQGGGGADRGRRVLPGGQRPVGEAEDRGDAGAGRPGPGRPRTTGTSRCPASRRRRGRRCAVTRRPSRGPGSCQTADPVGLDGGGEVGRRRRAHRATRRRRPGSARMYIGSSATSAPVTRQRARPSTIQVMRPGRQSTAYSCQSPSARPAVGPVGAHATASSPSAST